MDQSILSGRKAAGLSIKQPLGKEKQKDAGGG